MSKGRAARAKGALAEREVLRLLGDELGEVLKRNLSQSRGGGADCIEVKGFAIEVKRREQLSRPAWWRQACEQAAELGVEPMLLYRRNREPWQAFIHTVDGEVPRRIAARRCKCDQGEVVEMAVTELLRRLCSKKKSSRRWQALPGRQLELGTTGVRLEHNADTDMVKLYAPNGDLIASGSILRLRGLKELGEEYAEALGEFRDGV